MLLFEILFALELARLPAAGATLPRTMQLTALGWGATEENSLSEYLRRGDVTPLDLNTCQELFEPYDTSITTRMLCTTGEPGRYP